MAAPYWIELGQQAFGLVDDERIAAVLYWSPADVGEQQSKAKGARNPSCRVDVGGKNRRGVCLVIEEGDPLH